MSRNLRVVDYSYGRRDSRDVDTSVPFTQNYEKTRTIQQANVVIASYTNKNYQELEELKNRIINIPEKTSDLTNDGSDGEHPFITNEVDDLVNYTNNDNLPNIDNLANYTKSEDLSTVATTGSYGDLLNTPTIPSISDEYGTSTSDGYSQEYINGLNDEIDENTSKLEGIKPIDNTIYANDFKCKNLLDLSSFTTTVMNGVTFTNNGDGTITVNGLASAVAYVYICLKKYGTGTFTLSGCPSNGSDSTYKQLLMRYSDYNGVDDFGNGATRTFENNIVYGVRIRIASGYNADNIIFKPMLEIGNEVTSFTVHKPLGEEIYSSNEIVIGNWINGKPLYRKVVNFGSLPNAGNKEVNHDISNIQNIVNIYGYASDGSFWLPIPTVSTTLANNVNIYTTVTSIGINTGINRTSYNAYITLEYTKTTD